MDRNLHFERMRETGTVVIPMIREAYSTVSSGNGFLFDSLHHFVRKRTQAGQPLLRPYLVRIGYELTGRNNWSDVGLAGAAIEIVNVSSYQSNIAFDRKSGIISREQGNSQFISSMISLDLAIEVILKLRVTFGEQLISNIIGRIHEINRDIYVGQFYDLNVLSIDNLDLSMSEDEYLALYVQRCKKLGGSLTSLCFEVGCLLGGGSNNLLNTLRNIGTTFGTAGQMVNDISDFAPPCRSREAVKGYASHFSDLRAGKITYPLFHLLKHGSLKQRKMLMDVLTHGKIDATSTAKIIEYLCQGGSIKSAKRIVLSYYKKLKKDIREIDRCLPRNFLSLAFSSLVSNRYFFTLRNYVGTNNQQEN